MIIFPNSLNNHLENSAFFPRDKTNLDNGSPGFVNITPRESNFSSVLSYNLPLIYLYQTPFALCKMENSAFQSLS